jgi:signal peptidase I, bacterial type
MNENEKKTVKPVPANDFNIRQEIYEWMQCVVIALIACVLVFVFIARVIDVIGDSMVPTLENGDKIVITRLAGDYKQGDIVVLRKDTFREEPIVKRIIAVAGQTINIDFDTGIVYVDGKALQEDYVNEPTYKSLDFKGPVTVPAGCVFVMGDNRNNSTDSRDDRIGCVDTRYILGKVVFRILPLSRIGAIYAG